MNNSSLNRMAHVPTNQGLERNIFDLSHSNKLTLKVGKLVPILRLPTNPGETFAIRLSKLLRSITPVHPTMDNAYADFFFFFIPNRLTFLDENYEDAKIWQKINGANYDTKGIPATETEAYTFTIKTVASQSAWDYMGLPKITLDTNAPSEEEINPAVMNGYVQIWNNYFRDQNLQNPITDLKTFCETDAFADCLPVCKLHDSIFTNLLPFPQRGDSVGIGLSGEADLIPDGDLVFNTKLGDANGQTKLTINDGVRPGEYTKTDTKAKPLTDEGLPGGANLSYKSGLKVDLTTATAITINELRNAFATQRMLERDARAGGGRYNEMLLARWNITIQDETIQIPQFLAGKRIPLNIQQVNQTSSTDATSPLGTTGAFSLTAGEDINFITSVKESGYILGLMCVRTANTYCQGIPKDLQQKNRLDFYNPEFSHIGEIGIKKKEIYITGKKNTKDNEILGFAPAWEELRQIPNKANGYFKDDTASTLDNWTYNTLMSAHPALNDDFIKEDRQSFTKTLAEINPAWDYMCDLHFKIKASRPLPLYGEPGLLDHK